MAIETAQEGQKTVVAAPEATLPVVGASADIAWTIVQMRAGERITVNEALIAAYQGASSPHSIRALKSDVEAIAAAGPIIDVANEYRVILSGRTALVGDFIGVGDAEVADLDVVLPGAADALYSPFAETGELTLGALTPASDEVSTTVTGTVSGDFAEDLELVQVTVVARDPAGRISGGAGTYVDELPSTGADVPFEAVFWDPLPEGTVFEAYAAL